MSGGTVDGRVAQLLDAKMRRALTIGVVRSPLGIAAMVAIVWRHVPHGRIALAVGPKLVASLATLLVLRALGRRAGGASRRLGQALHAVTVLSGACWGLVGVLPAHNDPWVHVLVAVYASSLVGSAVVSYGHARWLCAAFVVPFAVIFTTLLVASGDGEGTILGVGIAIWSAVAVSMHRELHQVYRSDAEREVGNEELVARLQQHRHEMEAMNARLVHEATHDALTGLANRGVFHEQLNTALAAARRYGGVVAVLYLDLDRFKVVNDSLGHRAGDLLLCQFARRVAPILRESDVVARLGGDEFSVLLTGLRDPIEAEAVAERVLSLCAEPFVLDGREVVTSVSIGLAYNWDTNDRADDLLRRADVALYKAKEGGRNRVERFDDSLRASLDRRLDDELAVRQALRNGEIVPWFQPEIDLTTGRIVGAEALARWVHPTDGVRLPGRFMPVIEECGLTLDLLRTVVNHAGHQVAAWDRAGLLAPGFRVWVNFDPDDVVDSVAASEYARFCTRIGLDPARMGVEVTERAVLRDHGRARAHLDALKALGVAVAVDDFGTGHSSLALLQSLPVDVVKVDRSFVRDMVDDGRDRALVQAIVRLARDLGLEPLAEGVENDEQRRLLAAMGCGLGQGYHYAPAVPASEFLGWLERGAPWLAEGDATSGVAALQQPRAQRAQGEGPQPAVAVAHPR